MLNLDLAKIIKMTKHIERCQSKFEFIEKCLNLCKINNKPDFFNFETNFIEVF